jgi:hypothetical protein
MKNQALKINRFSIDKPNIRIDISDEIEDRRDYEEDSD